MSEVKPVQHKHRQEDVAHVWVKTYVGLPAFGVEYRCGCTGTHLSSGKSVTGGDSIKDMDAEWLAAKAATFEPPL